MKRARVLGLLVSCLAAAACDATVAVRSTWPQPAQATVLPQVVPVAAQPDVDLQEPHAAVVLGQRVAFDGLAEGLAWPALARALDALHRKDVVTVQASRDVPVIDVLRAVWTARAGDVRLQTREAGGAFRAVDLRARRDGAPAAPGCHLAVFLRPDGSLRVAAPGGPREIAGERPAEALARSLEDERARCPIKYVAFGAESDASPWGPVFDVLATVDRERSAGEARYVLGQAMHAR